MGTYIAILRGINVSGHKLIKMKSLQEMFGNLGFQRVRTYIQSGNVVFESISPDPGKLPQMISDEILKYFGFEVPVIVLEKEELENIAASNEFITRRAADVSKLHVTILSDIPDGMLLESIPKEEYLPDEFCLSGKSIYLLCPNGYGNTKLSNTFFEKKLKVRATTRNWKTILELVNLSEQRGT